MPHQASGFRANDWPWSSAWKQCGVLRSAGSRKQRDAAGSFEHLGKDPGFRQSGSVFLFVCPSESASGEEEEPFDSRLVAAPHHPCAAVTRCGDPLLRAPRLLACARATLRMGEEPPWAAEQKLPGR